MMKLHNFYRRFAVMTAEERNTVLQGVRHDPETPFGIYKQLEQVRAMTRYYQAREEELLRIAEETFDQTRK